MTEKFSVIFEGKFSANLSPDEVRQNLLKLYKGRHEIVDLFFTGRRLMVKKDVERQTALRYKATLEKAGILSRIVAEQAAESAAAVRPDVQRKKVPPKQPLGAAVPAAPAVQKRAVEGAGRMDGAAAAGSGTAGGRGPRTAVPDAPSPPDKSHLRGSRLQNFIAVVMILLLILSAGMRLWAIKKSQGIKRPDIVASNGQNVCVHFNKTLYFLTLDGRLLQRLDLSRIGLTREPADVELLSNGDFLVGDLDKGAILRCENSGGACRKIGPAGDYRIKEYFKLLADEQRDMLFIADTDNHRLLVQDMEGSHITAVETASKIAYPNDMALDGGGRLWLSNTRFSSVLSFDVEEGRVTESEKKLELLNTGKIDLPGPSGDPKDLKAALDKAREISERLKDDFILTRPYSLAWDGEGNLWVSAGDGYVSSALVRVYDVEGKLLKRVPLGEKSIPVSMTRAGDKILVADSGLFQVLSINPGTGELFGFGDEGFRRELSGIGDELRLYESIKKWTGAGLWVLAFGTAALVVVIVVQRRKARRLAAPQRSIGRPTAAIRPAGEASESDGTSGPARRLKLEFRGNANEYFRIWVVNTFLTIITLGIYAAWAKVRTRKYFYRNTYLDGHPFDYTGDPAAILKGYVIVCSGLLIYYLTRAYYVAYSLIILALFGLVIPLLVYKSLRFFAQNSAYRNIRYRFSGTLADSYRTYLLYPLLIPFTLGLIAPYWEYRKKRYFFDNFAFGSTKNAFSGSHGPFYRVYILAGLAMGGLLFFGALMAGLMLRGKGGMPTIAQHGSLNSSVLMFTLSVYGVILLVTTLMQQFIYAWATNYCLGHSELGGVGFESRLSGGMLSWIRLSNIAAAVLSLGLLMPWAKVRRMRYITENIRVVTGRDLDDFTASVDPGESSYGDAATDFFDMEIGL